MKNRFNPIEAKDILRTYPDIPEDLALCIYASRLIGSESNLVLHGGGNTSVKLKMENILGDKQDILFVKGSGHDLSTIGPEGFCGLDLNFLCRLKNLETLTDQEMDSQLKARKIDATSPDPSVEALLHAFFPHKYVFHSHADSILVLTNQKNGTEAVQEALGAKVGILPYIMSGLPLAKGVAKLYESNPEMGAIVILNHGIFTFGNSAEKAYDLMIDYVSRAEAFIRKKTAVQIDPEDHNNIDVTQTAARLVQTLRGACAYRDAGDNLRRFYAELRCSDVILNACRPESALKLCRSGVLTPDHVTRTKNLAVCIEDIPKDDAELKEMVDRMVEDYGIRYKAYVDQQAGEKGVAVRKLDPFPRIFLATGVGLIALGHSRYMAKVAADIAEHTICAKLQAFDMGDYVPISDANVFDMEYWSLQQKKISKDTEESLQGQVALVTGAAGAIGFGIAEQLLSAGAVVVVSDVDRSGLQKVDDILSEKYGKENVESIVFDVTNFTSVETAFTEITSRAGGLDLLVPNAGIAHVATIENLSPEKFNQVTSVNLMGTFNTIKASIPVFRRQATGGNIVLISSKNVFDPGAAFGAYSASKAGAHQISRIAALELAELGVRVNMINPDAVFGDQSVSSKLWDLIGPDRMKSRGLDPEGLKEYYRQRNLLKISVTAKHVGNAVVFFASEQTPTTGATLPVDGGVPAACPR